LPEINDSAERFRRLQAGMRQQGVDLLALAPTVNMRYLLGFAPLADERPCFLLISPRATALVVPAVNADQVEARTGLEAIRWPDASGPRQAIEEALARLDSRPGAVLAADNTMRADALLVLQEIAAPGRTLAADRLMSALRIRKSETELEAMARSAALADEALLAGADACRPGATERDVAWAITRHFLQNGAEVVDFTIVASGPNGAFPHHETGSRRLEAGDTIILDIGATLDGYKSDITRVVHLGEPQAEVGAAYEAVQEANRRAREAAQAGTPARDVDRAARQALEEAGYGPYFVHRTGHGLGLEVHEPPWITSESDTLLEPGMVFSIEPGVYLPDRFGIRIEDIVAIRPEGACRRLTGLNHDLIVR
jgi:Xaa-Pro aminopeptidase